MRTTIGLTFVFVFFTMGAAGESSDKVARDAVYPYPWVCFSRGGCEPEIWNNDYPPPCLMDGDCVVCYTFGGCSSVPLQGLRAPVPSQAPVPNQAIVCSGQNIKVISVMFVGFAGEWATESASCGLTPVAGATCTVMGPAPNLCMSASVSTVANGLPLICGITAKSNVHVQAHAICIPG